MGYESMSPWGQVFKMTHTSYTGRTHPACLCGDFKSLGHCSTAFKMWSFYVPLLLF